MWKMPNNWWKSSPIAHVSRFRFSYKRASFKVFKFDHSAREQQSNHTKRMQACQLMEIDRIWHSFQPESFPAGGATRWKCILNYSISSTTNNFILFLFQGRTTYQGQKSIERSLRIFVKYSNSFIGKKHFSVSDFMGFIDLETISLDKRPLGTCDIHHGRRDPVRNNAFTRHKHSLFGLSARTSCQTRIPLLHLCKHFKDWQLILFYLYLRFFFFK